MSTIGTNAVSGLLNSQQRVEKSAVKIAIADTDAGRDVSQEGELVNIAQASNDFAANATVLKVDKQISKTLLDILA
jgi:hypothetical protein